MLAAGDEHDVVTVVEQPPADDAPDAPGAVDDYAHTQSSPTTQAGEKPRIRTGKREGSVEACRRTLLWEGEVEVLKVSSRSNPNSVAGAVAGVMRQEGAVEVQVVGAGALNQAVKAVAIARGYLAPSEVDLVCIPSFADVEIDGQGRTAIRLRLEDRLASVETTAAKGEAAEIDLTDKDASTPSASGRKRGIFSGFATRR